MIYFTLIPRPNDIDIKFVIPHRVEITYVIIKRPRKGQSKSVDVKFQIKSFLQLRLLIQDWGEMRSMHSY